MSRKPLPWEGSLSASGDNPPYVIELPLDVNRLADALHQAIVGCRANEWEAEDHHRAAIAVAHEYARLGEKVT